MMIDLAHYDSDEVMEQVAHAAALHMTLARMCGEDVTPLTALMYMAQNCAVEWEAPRKDDEE